MLNLVDQPNNDKKDSGKSSPRQQNSDFEDMSVMGRSVQAHDVSKYVQIKRKVY